MTIRAKIIASFVFIIAIFFSLSIWSHLRFKRANERLELVNQLFLPLSRQVTQLQGHLQGMVDDIRRNAQGTPTAQEDSTFVRVVRDLYPYVVQKRLAAIERFLAKHQTTHPQLIAELSASLSKTKEDFDRITQATERTGFDAVITSARGHLAVLSRRVDDESQRVVQAAQTEGKETALFSLGLSGFVLFFGLFALYFSCRAINPLPGLIESIRKLGRGDLDQSLKVKSSEQDEVSILAREYNKMLGALKERDKKILSQQAEIHQSERLATIGQLSAEVVHEIRNPLNAINLNIDWLANELRDYSGSSNAEITKTLSSISREIERLNQITECYLSRSRVKMDEAQRTPINEVWREIIEFEKSEKDRQIEIETDLAQEEMFVLADRSRMKQAFLNILKNAKESMPRGGKISVFTRSKQNLSEVVVSDTGCGMSDTIRQRTFTPFFTTKPNGTGIGLALTKQIVQEANGIISCDSILGKGTTFTFQFPASA